MQATVTWVGKCNEKGVAVNYEAWKIYSHTEEAGRILQETGLEGKESVTKKKASDKFKKIGRFWIKERIALKRSGYMRVEALQRLS